MPQWTIHAPMACTVVEVMAVVGTDVRAGQTLLVVEAMKMEHEIRAEGDARVAELQVRPGDILAAGEAMLRLVATASPDVAAESASARAPHAPVAAPQGLRADLRQVLERHDFTLDAQRPDAVAKRHAQGQRTARENIAALCDDGSFTEYGALAIAAQRQRRSLDDLVRNTPADGMVTGTGSVNAGRLKAGAEPRPNTRCVVMAYDATVLAGTQGLRNHQKTDRMLGIALQQRLPVILFAEGGGGRPGDTDMPIVAGLHVATFASYARLSGQVPVVGVVSGRCFAGNAALLGCSDVIIATRRSNIGMAGPAMVEGGGLGVFKPEQIGPSEVQSANGVIDLLVDDDDAAVAAAKQYLAYFQGRTDDWTESDPALLRELLPENRVRAYDMHQVLRAVADTGSLLELRAGFGLGVFTALARIEGRPVGLLASNPAHLGGAIDADAADKAARFMQLCDAHGLPIVSLVDTPGFMVGPEVEARAQVRHVSRLFVVGAQLRVPLLAVVLRKAYGLGAMAMTGGSLHAPLLTAARRVRRDGAGRRGAPGLPQGTGSRARRGRTRRVVRTAGRAAICQRFGAQHGGDAGDRCRDRPGPNARLVVARPGQRPPRRGRGRRFAGTLPRPVVTRAPGLISSRRPPFPVREPAASTTALPSKSRRPAAFPSVVKESPETTP
jgi:acetyl-CoA carboxylase carboxyltransferase component